MVKKIVIYFIFIFTLLGCNKSSNVDCENPDYSNCNTIEPVLGDVTILVTKLEKTSRIPLTLYQGKFGSPEELLFDDTLASVDTIITLDLNKNYYAVATYLRNGKTIYAVDGVFLEKKSVQECDSTCWSINNTEIDVRLK